MEVYVVYSIAFGCFFAAFVFLQIVRRLKHRTGRFIETHLRKWLLYMIFFPRRAGSSDCTVLDMVVLLSYLAGNAYCAFSRVSSREELAERLGKLCLVNIVPLYLGGRTSYIVDKWFGVDLSAYYFMHRWIGRVCLAHGLAHGALYGTENLNRVRGIEIAVSTLPTGLPLILIASKLLAICGGAAVLSLVFIRKRAYELFLFSHSCTVPAILVLLWFHVPSRSRLFYITTGASLGLWSFQKLAWLACLMHRNAWGQGGNTMTIIPHQSGGAEVAVHLRRSFYALPGQYIYISVPHTRSFGLGYLEAHPFYIAWQPLLIPINSPDFRGGHRREEKFGRLRDEVEPAPSGYVKDTIVLYVEAANGFTRRILQSNIDGFSVVVDGPYGRPPSLDRFDKVLFIASGAGIAAHLLHIRYLVEAHNAQTARVRRITVCWLLQRDDEGAWAEAYLRDIFKFDARDIVIVHIYRHDGHIVSKRDRNGRKEDRMYPSEALDMGAFLELEFTAEAGNMAACRKYIPSICHPLLIASSSMWAAEF